MSTRSELAAIRAQGLDRVRAATGQAERFTLSCACARHDRAFTAAFARQPGGRQFRCEGIDKIEHAPGALQRLTSFLRRPEPLKVAAADIDFASLSCPWCAARRHWTLCDRCKAMVCGAQTDGTSFRCRTSCSARFETAPLIEMDAALSSGGGGAVPRAIGRAGMPLLIRKPSMSIQLRQRRAVDVGDRKPRKPSDWALVLWMSFVLVSSVSRIAADVHSGERSSDLVGLILGLGLLGAFGANVHLKRMHRASRNAPE